MSKFPKLTADVADGGSVLRDTVWHHAAQSFSRAVRPFADRTAVRATGRALVLDEVDHHDEDPLDARTPCRSTYVYTRR